MASIRLKLFRQFLQFSKPILQSGSVQTKHFQSTAASIPQVEEVRIKFPWGDVAGKWWGPHNIRPILSLHGWQDNAGTFDTLIPLLPSYMSYLALDLPGHGLSSHLPDGCSYNTFDFLYVISYICKEYNWDKVSLMAHSMSSQLGYYYAGAFQDNVDMLISLDVLKPHSKAAEKVVNDIPKRIQALLLHDTRKKLKTEPPCYVFDDLVEKLHTGTFKSVSKETAPFLLNRNIAKSTVDPNKYYFTRDNRLKGMNYAIPTHDVNLELANRIICPHLFIKAINSPLYEKKQFYEEVLNILKEKPTFKYFSVEGSHHVHLSDPTKISAVVSEFIMKYRPE